MQAKILVPCAYLSGRVSYKYIVVKGKEKDSKGKLKELWEQLPGGGTYKNRCLQIPKERCQTGGVSFFHVKILILIFDSLVSYFRAYQKEGRGGHLSRNQSFKEGPLNSPLVIYII